MTPPQIIAVLETAKELPAAAMRVGVASAEDISPAIVAVVEKAADGVYLIPRQQQLLFLGVHVLAAARRTELFKPLLRLVKRDRDDLEFLLGDAVTETLTRVLISVYDGDAAAVLAALEKRTVDGYVRWALMSVLTRATFDGGIARETMHAFLDRFESDSLAANEDAAWVGWQDAIRLLCFEDLAPRVRATWSDGRNPQTDADKADWEEQLAAAIVDPDDQQRFIDERLHDLGDPLDALQWTVDPDKSEQPSRAIDRAALDDGERDWLHGFLESDTVPDGAMGLETLDGFFTALIASPELVLPSEYMPQIWGGEDPVYDSPEQAEYIMTLLMRHWNGIACRLSDEKPCLPLVANGEMRAQPWADGFMRGVSMRMAAWDQHLRHDEMLTTFLGHVLVLTLNREDATKEGIPPDERAKMVRNLPLAVLGIYLYWRDKRNNARQPETRRVKVGRNEPCPCGSGRKFKRCCGGPGVAVH